MAAKRGGKLNKSESVQVRFDPILKLAAGLAASKERRTLSSFTEMAVEDAVKKTYVAQDEGGNPVSAWQVAQDCWSPEPALQLNSLANHYPDLLTVRERKMIAGKKFISGSSFHQDADKNIVETILTSEGWGDLCQYADDEIDFVELMARLRAVKAQRESS